MSCHFHCYLQDTVQNYIGLSIKYISPLSRCYPFQFILTQEKMSIGSLSKIRQIKPLNQIWREQPVGISPWIICQQRDHPHYTKRLKLIYKFAVQTSLMQRELLSTSSKASPLLNYCYYPPRDISLLPHTVLHSPWHKAGGRPIQSKYWKATMLARKKQYLGQTWAIAFLWR